MPNKTIGSVMIIVGTAIGAGMLALPMVSMSGGFLSSELWLALIWMIMSFTALLILELTLAFKPYRNNFSSMAVATIGKWGRVVVWISCLLLLYALDAAYIAGSSSLITNLTNNLIGIKISSWLNTLGFTFLLGGVVTLSTKTVDYLNRSLLSFKGILLIVSLILLMPHVNFVSLIANHHSSNFNYFSKVLPIFLCAFGFHTVIPSISNYLNSDVKKIRLVILSGVTIIFVIYSLWLLVTLGVTHHGENVTNPSVDEFINLLIKIAQTKIFALSINLFANIAMTTSFLGVSLGLFDFLADGFKRSNKFSGRMQTAVLTFTLPLIFALFYPKGFVLALGQAAIFFAVIGVILPVIMVYKMRHNPKLNSAYRVCANNLILSILLASGIIIIFMQIYQNLN